MAIVIAQPAKRSSLFLRASASFAESRDDAGAAVHARACRLDATAKAVLGGHWDAVLRANGV
jgi:hypothetical protein